jgi:glycine betaine/proline transport system permease protein
VIATVVFAMPPMIRLTALGISQVPANVKESALAFGATPAQLLFKVELPLSLPSLMAGVNQTVMMSLSMVVIAALIGAGGLGFEVLFALQQVDAGKGLLSGLAIVVCAMVVDRIIQGSRIRQRTAGSRAAGKES